MKSRPTYPADRLTLNLADMAQDVSFDLLALYFNMNGLFGVDIIFEDLIKHITRMYKTIFTTDNCILTNTNTGTKSSAAGTDLS